MIEAPSVTLEEFARLTAQIDGGESVERVLSERGLDPEGWTEVQRSWLQRMAERAAAGKPSLHQRFVALLEEQRREVAAARKASKKIDGPLPGPPKERKAPVPVRRRPAAQPDSPAVPPAPAPSAPPRREPRPPPSVAAVPPRAPEAAPKPGRPPTVAMPAMPPTDAQALPFAEEPAALPFAKPRPKPPADDAHILPFRSKKPAAAERRPGSEGRPSPLPFTADAEPDPPPPSERASRPAVGSTMAMSETDVAAARAALLPFFDVQGAQAADGEGGVALGSTASISPEEMAKVRASLPFGPPPAAEPAAPAPTGTWELPPEAVPPVSTGTLELPPDGRDRVPTGTAALPPGASPGVPTETAEAPPDGAPRAPALPFAPAASSASSSPGAVSTAPAPRATGTPALTLEQYAWLCATIERSAARAEETLAWLRMSAEQKEQLDAQWREAMARDPALAQRFEALRRSYLSPT